VPFVLSRGGSVIQEIEAYLGIWLRLELEAKAEFAEARTAWVNVDPDAELRVEREALAILSTAKAKLARAEGGVSALKMILEKLRHDEKSHDPNRREPNKASKEDGPRYIPGD
jgi:hypothetical protein